MAVEYVNRRGDRYYLAELVKRYCKHLGKDSFYELASWNPDGEIL